MRSKPGMMEQYSGHVDVVAPNTAHAVDQAFRELTRGAFPDRGPGCWIVEKVEQRIENRQFQRGVL